MRTIKRYVPLVGLLVALLGFSSEASATPYTFGGSVYLISAFASGSGYASGLEIQGITSEGRCVTDSTSGFVIIRIESDTSSDATANRLYALALLAFQTGRKLTVTVDDSILLNGDCQAQNFALGLP